MKMFKNHFLLIPIILLLTTTFFSCRKMSQNELTVKTDNDPKYFYYYRGQKRALTLNTELINIVSKTGIVKENYAKFGTIITKEENKEVLNAKTQSTSPTQSLQTLRHSGQLKLTQKKSEQEYLAVINELKQVDRYADFYPAFIDPDGLPVNITSLFNVELQSPGDYEILTQLANAYGATIVSQNDLMPLWYTLSSTSSALDMAALFYQTGYFSSTEPDLSTFIPLSCPTDPYFGNQWGAYNTGQRGGTPGVDIQLCGALNQTRNGGAVINVAVVDEGIDFSHEDLNMSLYPTLPSYDAITEGSQVVHSPHGTAVAGIIGARENGIGVTGVAPWCRLMSASWTSPDGFTSPYVSMLQAKALTWAYEHGADVINCSWAAAPLNSLDRAISNALNYGRNGKGCIVVFGSGNGGYRPDVEYPANSNPGILVVGAVTQCGTRKNDIYGCVNNIGSWFSSYGPQLDVMAPGTLIPTTDITGGAGYTDNNYNQNWDGTSAACAHVSGLAALILSKNPTLYGYEVRNIIESTAQKVGPYVYSPTSGRPNGTWNQEMGYGVINASAAVAATQTVIAFGTLYYGNITNGN